MKSLCLSRLFFSLVLPAVFSSSPVQSVHSVVCGSACGPSPAAVRRERERERRHEHMRHQTRPSSRHQTLTVPSAEEEKLESSNTAHQCLATLTEAHQLSG